jgi:hypothetical protein
MTKIPPSILSAFVLASLSAVAYSASLNQALTVDDSIYLPSIKHLETLGWCDHISGLLVLTPLGEKAFCQLHGLEKLDDVRGISRDKYSELRRHNCMTDACGLVEALGRPSY